VIIHKSVDLGAAIKKKRIEISRRRDINRSMKFTEGAPREYPSLKGSNSSVRIVEGWQTDVDPFKEAEHCRDMPPSP
jgi:hypothetical protein